MNMNPIGLPDDASIAAPTGREREVMWDLLRELQGRIDLIPPDVLGFSTATVRVAFQRFHDRMATKYTLADTTGEDTGLLDEDELRELFRKFLESLDLSPEIAHQLEDMSLGEMRKLLYENDEMLSQLQDMIKGLDGLEGQQRLQSFMVSVLGGYGVELQGEWTAEQIALTYFGTEFALSPDLCVAARIAADRNAKCVTLIVAILRAMGYADLRGIEGTAILQRVLQKDYGNMQIDMEYLGAFLPPSGDGSYWLPYGTYDYQRLGRPVLTRDGDIYPLVPNSLTSPQAQAFWMNMTVGTILFNRTGDDPAQISHVAIVMGWGARGTGGPLYSSFMEAVRHGVLNPIPFVAERGTGSPGPHAFDTDGGGRSIAEYTQGFGAYIPADGLVQNLSSTTGCVARVIGARVNLRTGPSRQSAVLLRLEQGTPVVVPERGPLDQLLQDRVVYWYRVQVPIAGTGWLHGDTLETAPCRDTN